MTNGTFLKKFSSLLFKPGFWLLLIFPLALAVRCYHITCPINDMHAFRQTQTAGLIRDYYRNGINMLYPTIITLGKPGYLVLEFPLYQTVSALLYRLFIPDVIVARIFTIITGLFSIFFVYRISSRFIDKRSSVLAAFFFAFMPFDIFFQRVPMQDTLTILVSLMMLDFLLEGIWGKVSYLLMGIIAASLGFMMKSPFVAPLFLPVFYLGWARHKESGGLFGPRLLLAFFVPFTAMVLWQHHANFVNDTYCNRDGYPFRELYSTFVVKLHPFNRVYFGTLAQRLDPKNYLLIAKTISRGVLTFPGLLLFAAGAVSLAVKRKAGFLSVWLFSLLLVMLIVFPMYIEQSYWLLPLCPVLSIFCGAGAGSVLDFMGKYGKKAVFISAIIIVSVFLFQALAITKYFFRGNSLTKIGTFIDEHTEKDAMIAIVSPLFGQFDPTMMYFADRHGFNVPANKMDGKMLAYLVQQQVKYIAEIDLKVRGGSTLVADVGIFDISSGKPAPKAAKEEFFSLN